MKRTDNFYSERAAKILQHIRYVTVATVTPGGEPWNSPVRVVWDEELNFYWFSDKDSQHSRNVRAHNGAYCVVYDSTVYEGQGAGVYVRAKVAELTDEAEIRRARQLKSGRDDNPAAFLGEAVRRVYKAVPVEIWTNAVEWREGVFVRDYRVGLALGTLRAAYSRTVR